MMKVIYNKEKIVSIEIHPKKVCRYFTRNKPKKNLIGRFFQVLKGPGYEKDGFEYNSGFSGQGVYTKEQLERGDLLDIKFKVIGDQVFYNPYLVINFESEVQTTKTFSEISEIMDYLENEKIDFSNKLIRSDEK